jgi:transcriptional activator FlhC
MRITDDRYQRERAHHDLALRMISHEARTCTIRAFTGLTDDRIRKLYRSYLGPRTSVRRRRGKSPRQVEFFTRNLAALLESSCLAGVLYTHNVIGGNASTAIKPSLALGTRFCDAYECYRCLFATSELSFEHAWCLVRLLTEACELTLARCTECGNCHIANPVARNQHTCPLCRIRATPLEQIPSVKKLLQR